MVNTCFGLRSPFQETNNMFVLTELCLFLIQILLFIYLLIYSFFKIIYLFSYKRVNT